MAAVEAASRYDVYAADECVRCDGRHICSKFPLVPRSGCISGDLSASRSRFVSGLGFVDVLVCRQSQRRWLRSRGFVAVDFAAVGFIAVRFVSGHAFRRAAAA
jgi:hypothetical protein